MLTNKQQSLMPFYGTIFLAMCLKIVPFPRELALVNPDWVLLVLIYSVISIPEKVGVFHALIIGIFVDVLTGRLLGQYALIYALISFFCLKLHRRLRQYPLPQQALFIFCCLFFSQIMMLWIENIQSYTEFSMLFFLPVVMGTVVWPLLGLAFRLIHIRGSFN